MSGISLLTSDVYVVYRLIKELYEGELVMAWIVAKADSTAPSSFPPPNPLPAIKHLGEPFHSNQPGSTHCTDRAYFNR